MKTLATAIRAGASCVVIFALAACAKSSAATQYDKAADEAEIRAIIDGIARDFNVHDTSWASRYYAKDSMFLGLDKPAQNGLGELREALAAIAAGLPPGVEPKFQMHTDEIVISGDLAYERGTYGSPATGPGAHRHIHIFKRQADGHWKAWRLMENAASPAR
jgi:ketosteroid isomerase-like protein